MQCDWPRLLWLCPGVPSPTLVTEGPTGNSHTRRASQLISLSDLENDFINPHDASAQINAWVVRNQLAFCANVHVAFAVLLAICLSHNWACTMRRYLSTASRRHWS